VNGSGAISEYWLVKVNCVHGCSQVNLRTDDRLKLTPLMLAAMGNQLDVVRLLLQHGASIHDVDRSTQIASTDTIWSTAFTALHCNKISYIYGLQCRPALRNSVDLWIRTYIKPVKVKMSKTRHKICPGGYTDIFTVYSTELLIPHLPDPSQCTPAGK